MTTATSIRCFEVVKHPYKKVCSTLSQHSNRVFHIATRSAETRAEDVAADLHIKIAGIDVNKEILVNVKSYTEFENRQKKQMTVSLEWKAAQAPQLFPTMVAQLHVSPIDGDQTQLDFQGEYKPPWGVLGKAIDVLVGHRIAEASVHHFVHEIAEYLRQNIR